MGGEIDFEKEKDIQLKLLSKGLGKLNNYHFTVIVFFYQSFIYILEWDADNEFEKKNGAHIRPVRHQNRHIMISEVQVTHLQNRQLAHQRSQGFSPLNLTLMM